MPKVQRGKTDNKTAPYTGMSGGSGIPTNKKHGQHLLKNPGIIDKIVAACDLKPSDTVFEIGPGAGALTLKLCEQAKKVIAYEIDPRMAAEVKKRASGQGRTNLEVKDGDCLRTEWPIFEVCATNLPYQISSPFMFKLLAHKPAPRCTVVMFQKEFAERLIAKVGEKQYGRLALNTSLFVKVSAVCKVARGSFNPPPEVDSMVVKVVPREPPIHVDFREWDGLMRICFCRKRKTLRSSFTTKANLRTMDDNYKLWCLLTDTEVAKESMQEMVMACLNALSLADQRAIRIDLDMFFRLLLEFNTRGIHFANAQAGTKIGAKTSNSGNIGNCEDLFVDAGAEEDDDGMDDE